MSEARAQPSRSPAPATCAGPGSARAALFEAALLVGFAALALSGCKADPASKIEGWPPPPSAFRDTAPAEPDTYEPPDTVPVEAPDTVGHDPDALPSEPCAAVVALACRYYGPYSAECAEVRARPPDGDDPDTRAACDDLVTRYVTEEQDKRANPCRRHARLVCRELGAETRACQVARDAVGRMLTARQKRACLGELLMFEARALRH